MSASPFPDKLSRHLSAQGLGLPAVAGAGPDVGGPDAGGPDAGGPGQLAAQVLGFEFRAQASEYTRLWLVNIALCVITLGLYLPWARVRLRQYLYQHTFLQGHSFSYDASPRALLLSYLLLGGLFWLFSLSTNLQETQWISAVLVGVFALLYPVFLYRSLRFQARNTVYRGLRFGFGGTWPEAYALYGLLPLTYSLTLGLTVPLAQYLQRRYVGSGLSYGQARGQFSGTAGQTYLLFLWAFLGMIVLGVAWVLLFLVLLPRQSMELDKGWHAIWPLALAALVMALLWWILRETLHAALLKYLLEHTQLGPLRLRVRFKPLALAWVSISNMALQLLTLGLATPWAMLRKARFLLGHIEVLTTQPLSDYRAAASRDEAALGEAATELFDIGLGL